MELSRGWSSVVVSNTLLVFVAGYGHKMSVCDPGVIEFFEKVGNPQLRERTNLFSLTDLVHACAYVQI